MQGDLVLLELKRKKFSASVVTSLKQRPAIARSEKDTGCVCGHRPCPLPDPRPTSPQPPRPARPARPPTMASAP